MWFKSHYTRHLEEEVARLQAENRAMLNSLLARSGFPPIDLAAAGGPPKKLAHRRISRGINSRASRPARGAHYAETAAARAIRARPAPRGSTLMETLQTQ